MGRGHEDGAAAKPDEIAAAISWLASDEASNVNGAIVALDGGWSTAGRPRWRHVAR